jgi:hypothetical protein
MVRCCREYTAPDYARTVHPASFVMSADVRSQNPLKYVGTFATLGGLAATLCSRLRMLTYSPPSLNRSGGQAIELAVLHAGLKLQHDALADFTEGHFQGLRLPFWLY